MNVFAAGLSLLLLGGMGIWGYKLAVRDVTGVPVVRAMEGPMRIQPEDPGGEEAAYQGYSVNAVQGLGGAEPPADTLALAPRNTGLAPEDISPTSGASVSAAPVAVAQAPAPATTGDT
ncbi:MAG TPA: SPOR domain-containing protein, partial [Aliiroseovarius sp.]|nr:SPOR domain-containing protein [Aliiroseovarius sp.]